jgi:di/tricarboxylate transporter
MTDDPIQTKPDDDNIQKTIDRDEFIFNLISSRNNAEFERCNSLDNKASGVVGFAGIIIGLIGGLISFSQNSPIFFYYQSFRVILLLGILALAGSIFFCIFAYSTKIYKIVPNTSWLIEKYAKDKDKNKSDIIQVVGKEISETIKINIKINDGKAEFVKYGLILFALGMAMIVIFICGLLIV